MVKARRAPAKTRKRRKKDKNAPKRPMSSYFLFSAVERKKVKAAHPAYGVTQVAKELGKRWGQVSPAKRKPFEAKAAKLKAAYAVKKAAYDKKVAKTGPPKRPMSAYFLFSADERASITSKHPKWPVTKVAKELGRRWKAATPAKKGPYAAKAARLKSAYGTKKKAYDAKHPKPKPAPKRKATKKKRKATKKKRKATKKKRKAVKKRKKTTKKKRKATKKKRKATKKKRKATKKRRAAPKRRKASKKKKK